MDRDRWREFGEWLGALVEATGESKKDIAERAGISPSTLQILIRGGRNYKGRWELPSPTGRNLRNLADAVGVPRHEMYDRAGRDFETMIRVIKEHQEATLEERVVALEQRLDRVEEKLDRLLEEQ